MLLDRRRFLSNLLGTAVIASTNPVHFLAPAKGWHQSKESNLLVPDIFASIEEYSTWKPLGAQLFLILGNS